MTRPVELVSARIQGDPLLVGVVADGGPGVRLPLSELPGVQREFRTVSGTVTLAVAASIALLLAALTPGGS